MTHKLLSIDVQGVANGQYLVLMNGEATVVDGGKVLPFTDTFRWSRTRRGRRDQATTCGRSLLS